jgi:hypothetical protein
VIECTLRSQAQALGDSCRVSLIAKRDVEPNEELCISYVPLSWTRATRSVSMSCTHIAFTTSPNHLTLLVVQANHPPQELLLPLPM